MQPVNTETRYSVGNSSWTNLQILLSENPENDLPLSDGNSKEIEPQTRVQDTNNSISHALTWYNYTLEIAHSHFQMATYQHSPESQSSSRTVFTNPRTISQESGPTASLGDSIEWMNFTRAFLQSTSSSILELLYKAGRHNTECIGIWTLRSR